MIKIEMLVLDRHPERLKRPDFPVLIKNTFNDNTDKLDKCANFQEVFSLVKKSVKASLNRGRAGLMLYLVDLPLGLGAYHEVGSNGIVMNRALLEQVIQTADSKREINAFVYSILLHEYIHTLGCIDELQTRKLTYLVSKETFGEDHIATQMAEAGPWAFIKLNPQDDTYRFRRDVEIVKNFEIPEHRYIS